MLLRRFGFAGGFGLIVTIGTLWTGILQAQPQSLEANLISSDCVKCHADITMDIEKGGMAHKTEVTCRECHDGHPPQKLEIIPACSACHPRSASSSHYDLAECLSCHNPHKPLEIRLARYITDPCLTCHKNQIKELRAFPSHHSTLDCTSCHETWHGNVPDCTSCHRPHSETMVEADCVTCHLAHRPLDVTFTSATPSRDCVVCHGEVFEVMSRSASRHKEIACVACHQALHKAIPACETCHGSTPHAPGLLKRFPDCATCHNSAHDLTM